MSGEFNRQVFTTYRAYPATIEDEDEFELIDRAAELDGRDYFVGAVRNGSTFVWIDGVEKGQVRERRAVV